MRMLAAACLLSLALIGCTTTPGAAPPASVRAERIHALIDLQGDVDISREGWRAQAFVPASFGTLLRDGDLLRLGDKALAKVVCSDLSVRPVGPGTGAVPCLDTQQILSYQGRLISSVRATELEIPQVIVPRSTMVLDARPTIRWRAVPGASSYTVRITNSGWEAEVRRATEVVYPADAPALLPGESYKVIVVAGERQSDEGEVGLGFTVMEAEQAQVVRAEEAKIRNLALSDAAQSLLIANLYASNGLYAEAMLSLEGLIDRIDGPALPRMIADWYVQVGVGDDAREYYQLALARASPDDVEYRGAIHSALASIALATGDVEAARGHLAEARASYEQLGDTVALQELNQLARQIH